MKKKLVLALLAYTIAGCAAKSATQAGIEERLTKLEHQQAALESKQKETLGILRDILNMIPLKEGR